MALSKCLIVYYSLETSGVNHFWKQSSGPQGVLVITAFGSGNSHDKFYNNLDGHWSQNLVRDNFIIGKGHLSPSNGKEYLHIYIYIVIILFVYIYTTKMQIFHNIVTAKKEGALHICIFQKWKAGFPLVLQTHNEKRNIFSELLSADLANVSLWA